MRTDEGELAEPLTTVKEVTIRDPNDEAFGTGRFHIEQMDTGTWWMVDSHGCELRIVLKTKRGAEIQSFMEITGQCAPNP